jgi:hypothetical protein
VLEPEIPIASSGSDVNGSGYRKENANRVSSQHSLNSPLQGL